MAYLDFRGAELSGSPHVSLIAPQVVESRVGDTRFSVLEWLVIALAQRDSVRSLRTPGRFARAIAHLFGSRLESPLADQRLEALRRLAVFAWRDSFNVPSSELAAFRDAGFSTDQAELLLESVLVSRSREQVRRTAKLVQCKMVGQTVES
jgi:hypothetical protein